MVVKEVVYQPQCGRLHSSGRVVLKESSYKAKWALCFG